MRRRIWLATCLAVLTLPVGVAAATTSGSGSGPAVTVRVEGAKKTLLLPAVVHVHRGWITKYGAPKGKCPARSAQGALNVATHGHWKGKWYSSFNEYFINTILGEKPTGTDYWTVFVNNKTSKVGACDIKLRRGQTLLFAVTNGGEFPSRLATPQTGVKGQPFKVKVLGYTSSGKSAPLAGVRVTGNGITPVKTNSQGVATVRDNHAGALVLRASPGGYIRTEAIVHVAR
jgi:hypothetical protein